MNYTRKTYYKYYFIFKTNSIKTKNQTYKTEKMYQKTIRKYKIKIKKKIEALFRLLIVYLHRHKYILK